MDDSKLRQKFEDQSILNEDFSHEKHIRIAYIYLSGYGYETGLEKIIDGIKQLNAVNKVPGELRTRGFHQTLTVAWARLVYQRLEQKQTETSSHFLELFPELLNPGLVNEYYSPDRLMSWEAKREFVEPDLDSFD